MREPIAPMLATLVSAPVDAAGWVYEEKYDGIRALAYRRARRTRLWSRSGLDLTADYPEIREAVAALPDGELVLDGEIVAFDARRVSRFQLLQRRALGARVRPVYAVFDCLERDGISLIRRPLSERRRALEEVLAGRQGGALLLARRLTDGGTRAYRLARERGWEGIIAKDENAPYEPGRRSRSWLKVKVRHEGEFVIGGYTPPAGAREHLGALLVGLFDGAALRFVGKVGTGFSGALLRHLADRLRPLRSEGSPFDPPPRIRDAAWVRPRLVAQIAFAEWTADGKLRQPAFLGLRTDKPPRECTWAERDR